MRKTLLFLLAAATVIAPSRHLGRAGELPQRQLECCRLHAYGRGVRLA